MRENKDETYSKIVLTQYLKQFMKKRRSINVVKTENKKITLFNVTNYKLTMYLE